MTLGILKNKTSNDYETIHNYKEEDDVQLDQSNKTNQKFL